MLTKMQYEIAQASPIETNARTQASTETQALHIITGMKCHKVNKGTYVHKYVLNPVKEWSKIYILTYIYYICINIPYNVTLHLIS